MENSLLLNKPIEELSEAELKREIDIHHWLSSLFSSELHELDLTESRRSPPEYPKNYEELYAQGEIDKKEYLRSKRIDTANTYYLKRYADKREVAEILMKHHESMMLICRDRAVCIGAEKRLREFKPNKKRRKRRKVRKLPSQYGYDPRRRCSRTNYRREDWGKTRDSNDLHQAYKKLKCASRKRRKKD